MGDKLLLDLLLDSEGWVGRGCWTTEDGRHDVLECGFEVWFGVVIGLLQRNDN